MGVLRLGLGDTPLRAEHERLLRTALRRGEQPPEPPPGARIEGDHSEAVLELARATWRERMVHEHHSAAVFSRLLPQLMEAEAPLELKTSVLRMGMDELRHAALCASVVEALGGSAEVETSLATDPLPEHADCPPAERALRNVMFVGCLSETVALALLTEEAELTTEPLIRRVTDQLRADEVLHAKLGWSYLGAIWPTLDARGRERTHAFLRRAFGYLEARMHEAMPVGPERTGDELEGMHALGLVDGRQARELFRETIREVIVPQLEAYGVDAASAWRDRRAPGGG